MDLPPQFVANVTAVFDGGDAWLADLPRLLGELAREWQVQIGPLVGHLSFNYVCYAMLADGTPAMLKVGFPRPELTNELAVLRLVGSDQTLRVLRADTARGALLLERLEPATQLSSLPDAEATEVLADVMRVCWRPVPPQHSFPALADYYAGLNAAAASVARGEALLPPELVRRAVRRFAELQATAAAPVVLHGDLHHDNVLYDTRRGWVMIDPKGVIGEPAAEVGALMHNPISQNIAATPDLPQVLRRRLHILSERLGLPYERLHGYSFVYAVLSGWWDAGEVGLTTMPQLVCARALLTIDR